MDRYLAKCKKISDYHLDTVLNQGFANKGCNGPYGDNDTEMRNTAHWAVTYAILFEIFREKKYFDIVQVLGKYLLQDNHYGQNGVAICRSNANDDTNGVIGQAWIIEGLLACYDVTLNSELLEKAITVFQAQCFVEETGTWKICCSNQKIYNFDYVYNHNLWFAAAGSQILERIEVSDIRNKVLIFLQKSCFTYGVQKSGCLYHLVNFRSDFLGRTKFFLKMLLTDCNIEKYKDLNYLEKGYHLFDLYGFAILKNEFGDNPELNSKKLKKAVKFGVNPSNLEKLGDKKIEMNSYGYPYNSPAFEYPYVSIVLGNRCDETIAKHLLDIQFSELFDENTMMFSRNNKDPETLTARMYELMRYFQIRNKA